MDAMELIDILCEEHDKRSCNDDGISNGFEPTGNGSYSYRCQRCALIEIVNGNAPEHQHFQIIGLEQI